MTSTPTHTLFNLPAQTQCYLSLLGGRELMVCLFILQEISNSGTAELVNNQHAFAPPQQTNIIWNGNVSSAVHIDQTQG